MNAQSLSLDGYPLYCTAAGVAAYEKVAATEPDLGPVSVAQCKAAIADHYAAIAALYRRAALAEYIPGCKEGYQGLAVCAEINAGVVRPRPLDKDAFLF